MAAELKRALGLQPTLTAGQGGQFDVLVDGELVYSKAATQRFPDPDEVTGLLQARRNE